VRREFRKVTEAVGLGRGWSPRDLRHTFVSLMSADGVPIEEIARLAGHNRTATTELVYRHELRPVIRSGAEVMDRLFDSALPAAEGILNPDTSMRRRIRLRLHVAQSRFAPGYLYRSNAYAGLVWPDVGG
jgi:hypothetical protein